MPSDDSGRHVSRGKHLWMVLLVWIAPSFGLFFYTLPGISDVAAVIFGLGLLTAFTINARTALGADTA